MREDVVESGHGASMHMAASSRARSLVAKVSLECACLGQVSTVMPRVFWGECCVAAFSIMWHVAGIFTGHGHYSLYMEHIVPQPVFRQGGWHHVFRQGGWLWLARQVGKSTAINKQQPQ